MDASAVHLGHVPRLAGDIKRLGRFRRHAKGQLEGLDTGVQPRIEPRFFVLKN